METLTLYGGKRVVLLATPGPVPRLLALINANTELGIVPQITTPDPVSRLRATPETRPIPLPVSLQSCPAVPEVAFSPRLVPVTPLLRPAWRSKVPGTNPQGQLGGQIQAGDIRCRRCSSHTGTLAGSSHTPGRPSDLWGQEAAVTRVNSAPPRPHPARPVTCVLTALLLTGAIISHFPPSQGVRDDGE